MKNEGKKYRRSPISIVCYVLAAIMLVYVCYTIVSTVQTINEYYAQYGMSAQPIEYVTYSLQAALQYIVYMIVFFMCGYILDAVRMNNKSKYHNGITIFIIKVCVSKKLISEFLLISRKSIKKTCYLSCLFINSN